MTELGRVGFPYNPNRDLCKSLVCDPEGILERVFQRRFQSSLRDSIRFFGGYPALKCRATFMTSLTGLLEGRRLLQRSPGGCELLRPLPRAGHFFALPV